MANDMPPSRCKAPGCDRPARYQAACLCNPHYQAEYRKAEFAPCAVSGCHRQARSAKAQHCETHFYRLRRRGTLETVLNNTVADRCSHCGDDLPPMADRYFRAGRFCSARCAARDWRGSLVEAPCLWCKVTFRPIGNAVTCSDACSAKHKRRLARRKYARRWRDDPGFRDKVRQAEYARKAKRNGAGFEDFAPSEIFERDGWRCGLCGGAIDAAALWPRPTSPTLDHIRPLSRGGSHKRDNVQAAHLRCNLAKGARWVVVEGTE